jgi:hypothetical protein
MIDFNNATFMKLKPTDEAGFSNAVRAFLVDGEDILSTYKGARDGVIFTNRRIVVVNVQGLTGKKTDYTSLPYSKVQSFSIESAGHFDRDSELDIWFSGLGKVRLEFSASTDLVGLCKTISAHIL